LSGAFHENGNPRARGEFERNPMRRYWWVQPGAGMFLAAIFFIRRLSAGVDADNCTVHLVEGFVTGRHSHKWVAETLLDAFLIPNPIESQWNTVTLGGKILSIVALVNPNAGNAAPPVILKPMP